MGGVPVASADGGGLVRLGGELRRVIDSEGVVLDVGEVVAGGDRAIGGEGDLVRASCGAPGRGQSLRPAGLRDLGDRVGPGVDSEGVIAVGVGGRRGLARVKLAVMVQVGVDRPVGEARPGVGDRPERGRREIDVLPDGHVGRGNVEDDRLGRQRVRRIVPTQSVQAGLMGAVLTLGGGLADEQDVAHEVGEVGGGRAVDGGGRVHAVEVFVGRDDHQGLEQRDVEVVVPDGECTRVIVADGIDGPRVLLAHHDPAGERAVPRGVVGDDSHSFDERTDVGEVGGITLGVDRPNRPV